MLRIFISKNDNNGLPKVGNMGPRKCSTWVAKNAQRGSQKMPNMGPKKWGMMPGQSPSNTGFWHRKHGTPKIANMGPQKSETWAPKYWKHGSPKIGNMGFQKWPYVSKNHTLRYYSWRNDKKLTNLNQWVFFSCHDFGTWIRNHFFSIFWSMGSQNTNFANSNPRHYEIPMDTNCLVTPAPQVNA